MPDTNPTTPPVYNLMELLVRAASTAGSIPTDCGIEDFSLRAAPRPDWVVLTVRMAPAHGLDRREMQISTAGPYALEIPAGVEVVTLAGWCRATIECYGRQWECAWQAPTAATGGSITTDGGGK